MDEDKMAQLKELDTLKTAFFANICHEFRTPLTLILGVSDLLICEDSESQQHVAVLKRNAHKLMDMVTEVLDLGNLETQKIEPNLSEINLSIFLEELGLFFDTNGTDKQVTLAVELQAAQIMIMGDPDLLEKIITKLLRNAFRLTQDKGQVKLKISVIEAELNDELEIIVSYDGFDISETDSSYVSGHFFGVNSPHKVEGLSIGLVVMKEIVSLLKGSFSIKTKIDEGTKMWVQLPLTKSWLSQEIPSETSKGFLQERILSPADNAPEKSVSYSKEQNLLLIVDDNADMRNYVSRVFKDRFQIIQASNAIDGLSLANAEVPDLIISDLMMPEMDGYEFCKNIRIDVATSHIPFILLTANVSKDARLQAFECGVDDCLTKPFDVEEIAMRVNNLILQRKRLQKTYTAKIFSSNQLTAPSYSFNDLWFSDSFCGVINFS